MANGVTTQWFDIHVKAGNYLPLQKKQTLTQQQLKYQQKCQNQITSKQPQIDQFDDLQDDQFLRQYQAKRRAQLIQKAKYKTYGKVIQVTYDEYVKQVTQASLQSNVVLNMYQNHLQQSVKFNLFMDQLALKYPRTKFVKIIATKCVEKFPDEGCPCLVMYKQKKAIAKLAGAHKLLKGLNIQAFEQLLKEHGALNNQQ